MHIQRFLKTISRYFIFIKATFPTKSQKNNKTIKGYFFRIKSETVGTSPETRLNSRQFSPNKVDIPTQVVYIHFEYRNRITKQRYRINIVRIKISKSDTPH